MAPWERWCRSPLQRTRLCCWTLWRGSRGRCAVWRSRRGLLGWRRRQALSGWLRASLGGLRLDARSHQLNLGAVAVAAVAHLTPRLVEEVVHAAVFFVGSAPGSV